MLQTLLCYKARQKWAMFDRHNMCSYYLMGFCGSVPQTWLSADNTLEFFKGSNFSKTGQKEKGSKTVQLCNLVVNRCSTLQLPLTFLLGGVPHRCLAVVALNLYLALFQTSRKILCTRKPACFSLHYQKSHLSYAVTFSWYYHYLSGRHLFSKQPIINLFSFHFLLEEGSESPIDESGHYNFDSQQLRDDLAWQRTGLI